MQHSAGCIGTHRAAHVPLLPRAPTAGRAFSERRCHWLCRAEAAESDQPQASTSAPAGAETAAAAAAAAAAGEAPAGATPDKPKKLSAAAACSEALENIPITIIGDDTELNWAVCQALSKKLGWFPVCTQKVLLGLHKAEDAKDLEQKLGAEGLGGWCLQNIAAGLPSCLLSMHLSRARAVVYQTLKAAPSHQSSHLQPQHAHSLKLDGTACCWSPITSCNNSKDQPHSQHLSRMTV